MLRTFLWATRGIDRSLVHVVHNGRELLMSWVSQVLRPEMEKLMAIMVFYESAVQVSLEKQ